jgi:hypothetical protein
MLYGGCMRLMTTSFLIMLLPSCELPGNETIPFETTTQSAITTDSDGDATSQDSATNGDTEDMMSEIPNTDDGDTEDMMSEIPNTDDGDTTSEHSNTEGDDTTSQTTSSETPQYVSGSRIRAKYVLGEDGSKQWVGWYDSELKTDCGWSPYFESGKRYCIPNYATGISQYYADVACEDVLELVYSLPCLESKYAIRYSGSECNQRIAQLHRLGDEWTGKFYTKSGEICLESAPIAGWKYYKIGAVEDLSKFVSATEIVE